MIKWVVFLFTSISCFAQGNFSGTTSGCGVYRIGGIFKKNHAKIELVVLEKTQSEHHLTVSAKTEAKGLGFYFDRPVLVTAKIPRAMNGTRGEIDLLNATRNVRDPLSPLNREGFERLKEETCEK